MGDGPGVLSLSFAFPQTGPHQASAETTGKAEAWSMRISSSDQASDEGDKDAAIVIKVRPHCFPRASSSPSIFLQVPTPGLE